MSEWRPIDSAPKDGTMVLGAWAESGFMYIGCLTPKGAWFDGSDFAETWAHGPTHWMPLPNPPTQSD